jgi:hypothetical protein
MDIPKKILGLGILLTALIGWSNLALGAKDEVCVRNYLKPTGMDPCAQRMPNFSYSIHKDRPEEAVCIKTYADSNCKNSPNEFDHVYTSTGVGHHQGTPAGLNFLWCSDHDYYLLGVHPIGNFQGHKAQLLFR